MGQECGENQSHEAVVHADRAVGLKHPVETSFTTSIDDKGVSLVNSAIEAYITSGGKITIHNTKSKLLLKSTLGIDMMSRIPSATPSVCKAASSRQSLEATII